jgi:hypothetical protein
LSPLEINEINNNPLKIFKNFVNYAVGNQYYDVIGEDNDDHKNVESFCQYCNEKYRIIDQKYAPC